MRYHLMFLACMLVILTFPGCTTVKVTVQDQSVLNVHAEGVLKYEPCPFTPL